MLLKEILQECKHKGLTIGDYCEGWLIENGYVKNPCFGWEKLEVLKRFGLNPDMEAIPTKLVDENDYKEIKKSVVDEFGNKTGEFKLERMSFKTGKKTLAVADNFLNYLRWKKQQEKDEFIAEQILDDIGAGRVGY